MTRRRASQPPETTPSDYSANIGLFVVVFVGGAMLLASQLNLGSGGIIAGFTPLFFAIGVDG